MRQLRLVSLPFVLGLLACSTNQQQLTIYTSPSGAEVYLQRSGTLEVQAAVAGVSGTIEAGTFEDEFIFLGTTPVDFKFPLTKREASVDTEAAGGDLVRRYTEGILRVERRGYLTEERRLRFTGNAINVSFTLERSNE